MGMPRSWARIEFPARFLDDDIKKELANYYGGSENGEPDIEGGVFILEDGEAVCGEFEDLEKLLFIKGIPFDRETAMDWQQPPCRRVYRPATRERADIDENIQLNNDGDPAERVDQIRAILDMDDAANKLRMYLDKNFPVYPPLSDWAKEA